MTNMKRLFLHLLFVWSVITLSAQDFKLYYANNIRDVEDLSALTLANSGLNWREVKSGDIAGNQIEVNGVTEMFKSTDMKGRQDQDKFWRMRDNTLLCFRINDGEGLTGAYTVTMTAGQEKKTLITSAYFFVNIPYETGDAKIEVAKLTDTNKKIVFTYYIYDWNNESLYTFQLDQKRRATNKTYQLEYQLMPFESSKTTKPTIHILTLQSDKFQSFYVPDGYVLTGAWLRDGTDSNAPRLRLDISKFWRGADLADHFRRPQLSTAFKLDKHEGRDLMSFNMLGSGLMAAYDTLSLKVLGKRSRPVQGVRMNVERVDGSGKRVADDDVRLVRYDPRTQSYRVYTKGQPCYIEVIADGYYPTVYKYSGAIDSKTNELTANNCRGQVQLKRGDYRADVIALSNQQMAVLYERKTTVPRNNQIYSVFDEELIDLSKLLKKDTIAFVEDGGYQDKKIMNGEPVDKYGQLRVSLSVPKGSHLDGQPTLAMIGTRDSKQYDAPLLTGDNLLSADYPRFERDYYGMRYQLVGVLPLDQACQPVLRLGTREYQDFPKILRKEIDREKMKKQGEAAARKKMSIKEAIDNVFSPLGIDWMIGFSTNTSFAMNEKIRFNIKPYLDPLRRILDLDVEGSFNNNRQTEASGQPLTPQQQYANKLRDEYTKANINPVSKFSSNTTAFNTAGMKNKKWEVNELDDILKVDKFAFGLGWYGNARMGLSLNVIKANNNESPLTLKYLDATLGYGFFSAITYGRDVIVEKLPWLKKWTPRWINFGMTINVALYAQATMGLRNYTYLRNKKTESKMGWLLNGELTAKAGLELFAAIDFEKFGKEKKKAQEPAPAEPPAEKKDEAKDNSNIVDPSSSFDNSQLSVSRRAINPNSMLSFAAKGRGGLKGSLQFAVGGPLSIAMPNIGAMGMVFAGMGYSIEIKSLLVNFRRANARSIGKKQLWPDNNTNPLHPAYPNWAPSDQNASASLFDLPLPTRRADDSQDEEETPLTMGSTFLSNLTGEARPQLLANHEVVYCDEGTSNLNDNTIKVHALKTNTTTTLSTAGLSASHHDSDWRGGYEVVAYEEMTRAINDSELTGDSWDHVLQSNETEKDTRIVACIRQTDGTWKQTIVDDAAGYVKSQPKVAQQEDGTIGCVWKRGKFGYTLGNGEGLFYRIFVGQLMSSVYTPSTGTWSTPTAIMTLNGNHIATDYNVVMKDNRLLTAVTSQSVTVGEQDPQRQTLILLTQQAGSPAVSQTTEQIAPISMSLARVGDNAMLACVYERPDSTRDIHVKQLHMDGTIGEQGEASFGLRSNFPKTVKIVCDRTVDKWNDFAVLWTEPGSTVRTARQGSSETRQGTNRIQTVLNAARVYRRQSMEPTPYLSLGISSGERDITDYDAHIDDAQITAVYALTNEDDGQTTAVLSSQAFYNDFEYAISYTRRPLQSTRQLPVNINVSNTGTSPITKVTGKVNDQDFVFDNLNIPPFETEVLSWNYQVPEKFDGYLSATVTANYYNQYSAKAVRRANGEEVSLESTTKQERGVLEVPEEIECELLGQSVYYDETGRLVNAFEVELTDHSEAGLLDSHQVWVGIYPDTESAESITAEAEVMLTSSDFEITNDGSKAWATLKVYDVRDDIPAYLNLYVTGNTAHPDDPGALTEEDGFDVENLFTENLQAVSLYSTPDENEEPTAVQQVKKETSHKVHISKETGGVRLSNLEAGDTVRVFHADGRFVAREQADSGSLFVPLSQRGVYILSAGDEVFKFMF